MNEATWYKLKDGTWGVKIRHDGSENEQVKVVNKKGEEKTVWLVKRAAKFDDAQLWEITSEEPDAAFEAVMSSDNDPEPF